jgi:prepilin-type N-terminal cleavage/methylation domain-containing protein
MLRGSRESRASRSRARGFTAIEVLISMAIMFIGAAAVMTMQKTSIQGNLDARKADVASSIARAWVERIRHESMRWTQPSASSPTSNLPQVPGLNRTLGVWFRPNDDMGKNPGGVETMSYAFDILGRDLATGDIAANAAFCTEVRIVALQANLLYRVDVRVVWPRGIETVPNAHVASALSAGGNNWPCSDATIAFPDALDYTLFHAINVTTAFEENPAE